MIAQVTLPDPKGFIAMGWVLTVLISILGGYLLVLKIQVARREIGSPVSTNVQQPLVVEQAKVFVTVPEFTNTVDGLRKEIDSRVSASEKIFRDRFHKLDNDLNKISVEQTNIRESSVAQFKAIEGRLGALSNQADTLAISSHSNGQKLDRLVERFIQPGRPNI